MAEYFFSEASPDGTQKIYEKKLSFCTFSHDEIVHEIEDEGLKIIKDTYTEDCDEYCMYIKLCR